jgi:hypothetical protein
MEEVRPAWLAFNAFNSEGWVWIEGSGSVSARLGDHLDTEGVHGPTTYLLCQSTHSLQLRV